MTFSTSFGKSKLSRERVANLGRPDFSKNVYMYMVDILHQLIEESQQLPKDVVNIIMENITKKTKVIHD